MRRVDSIPHWFVGHADGRTCGWRPDLGKWLDVDDAECDRSHPVFDITPP